MVRHYVDEPVPEDALDRIVSSVRRAPSAGFSQGQRLVVVTDEARRGAIADLLGEGESVAEGYEPWLSSAPVHVVICTREEDYHERWSAATSRATQARRSTEEVVHRERWGGSRPD